MTLKYLQVRSADEPEHEEKVCKCDSSFKTILKNYMRRRRHEPRYTIASPLKNRAKERYDRLTLSCKQHIEYMSLFRDVLEIEMSKVTRYTICLELYEEPRIPISVEREVSRRFACVEMSTKRPRDAVYYPDGPRWELSEDEGSVRIGRGQFMRIESVEVCPRVRRMTRMKEEVRTVAFHKDGPCRMWKNKSMCTSWYKDRSWNLSVSGNMSIPQAIKTLSDFIVDKGLVLKSMISGYELCGNPYVSHSTVTHSVTRDCIGEEQVYVMSEMPKRVHLCYCTVSTVYLYDQGDSGLGFMTPYATLSQDSPVSYDGLTMLCSLEEGELIILYVMNTSKMTRGTPKEDVDLAVQYLNESGVSSRCSTPLTNSEIDSLLSSERRHLLALSCTGCENPSLLEVIPGDKKEAVDMGFGDNEARHVLKEVWRYMRNSPENNCYITIASSMRGRYLRGLIGRKSHCWYNIDTEGKVLREDGQEIKCAQMKSSFEESGASTNMMVLLVSQRVVNNNIRRLIRTSVSSHQHIIVVPKDSEVMEYALAVLEESSVLDATKIGSVSLLDPCECVIIVSKVLHESLPDSIYSRLTLTRRPNLQ